MKEDQEQAKISLMELADKSGGILILTKNVMATNSVLFHRHPGTLFYVTSSSDNGITVQDTDGQQLTILNDELGANFLASAQPLVSCMLEVVRRTYLTIKQREDYLSKLI